MARWIDWTETQKQIYADWVANRPEVVRNILDRNNLHMDRLYRLKTTGQNVVLYSISENGTVTVHVLEKYNMHKKHPHFPFEERAVFGIDPADLEETDLPEGVQMEGSKHIH